MGPCARVRQYDTNGQASAVTSSSSSSRAAEVAQDAVALASAAQAAPAFNELDKDHDGMLTRAEAGAVKGLDFAKADTNKDGRLDRAEYAAAIA